VLCGFRAQLLVGEQETLLLDTLLTPCRERGWFKARERQRTDSTHILAAVRARPRPRSGPGTARSAARLAGGGGPLQRPRPDILVNGDESALDALARRYHQDAARAVATVRKRLPGGTEWAA
jgi:hypothetical protein